MANWANHLVYEGGYGNKVGKLSQGQGLARDVVQLLEQVSLNVPLAMQSLAKETNS